MEAESELVGSTSGYAGNAYRGYSPLHHMQAPAMSTGMSRQAAASVQPVSSGPNREGEIQMRRSRVAVARTEARRPRRLHSKDCRCRPLLPVGLPGVALEYHLAR